MKEPQEEKWEKFQKALKKGCGGLFPLIDKFKTGINLRRMLDVRGITAKEVQQYLELGCVQSVYRWFSGQSMPTIDNLYALSELLGVTIDELVCGNKKEKVQESLWGTYGLHEKRLYMYYCKLNNKCVA